MASNMVPRDFSFPSFAFAASPSSSSSPVSQLATFVIFVEARFSVPPVRLVALNENPVASENQKRASLTLVRRLLENLVEAVLGVALELKRAKTLQENAKLKPEAAARELILEVYSSKKEAHITLNTHAKTQLLQFLFCATLATRNNILETTHAKPRRNLSECNGPDMTSPSPILWNFTIHKSFEGIGLAVRVGPCLLGLLDLLNVFPGQSSQTCMDFCKLYQSWCFWKPPSFRGAIRQLQVKQAFLHVDIFILCAVPPNFQGLCHHKLKPPKDIHVTTYMTTEWTKSRFHGTLNVQATWRLGGLSVEKLYVEKLYVE